MSCLHEPCFPDKIAPAETIETVEENARLISPSPKTDPPVPAVYLPWLLVSALFLVCAVMSFTVTTEDAYISFRYAENVAQGYGLAFNPGESAAEGYSNPTWVLLLSICANLELSTVTAGRCLGLLFGALTLLEIMILLGIARGGKTQFGIMAAVAFATAP